VIIEVVLIDAVALCGKAAPTLGRDTMFAVLMIVLNGVVRQSRFAARETDCNLLSAPLEYLTEIGYVASQGRNDKRFSAWQRA
jgi:hypothetical protein